MLSNQKCGTQPTFINLHPNGHSQELNYYPFAVKLDRRFGRCNTLNEISNKSCELKCKFHGRKRNSNQWWNNDKYQYECKKHHICEKDYIWNPALCSFENGRYLVSFMDDSVITCDEIIDAEATSIDEEAKTVSTNFNEKNISCKIQNFYILLSFLLITIALLIAVSIYYYLIKY